MSSVEIREVITSSHIYNLLGTGRLEVGIHRSRSHEEGDVEAVDYVIINVTCFHSSEPPSPTATTCNSAIQDFLLVSINHPANKPLID